MDDFPVIVHWSEEDKEFIATCHEYPLLSAFGKTEKEAIEDFKIVYGMAMSTETI